MTENLTICHASQARVLELVPVLDFGGVESVLAMHAALLAERVAELRICTFWKDGAAASMLRSAGVPVDVLGVDPSIRNPRATFALARYLRRLRPEVLHARIGEANVHGVLAGRLVGVPVVVVEEVGNPGWSRLGSAIMPRVYALADAAVGVSEATAALLRDSGVPASRVRAIPNFVGDHFLAPAVPPPDDGHFRVVAVGRLDQVKNFGFLLDVVARVHRIIPQIRLTIVGDGPERVPLMTHAKALGIDEVVKFAGFQPNVRDILDAHDLCVMPSRSEGFGIALAEAMARARPVVASRVGGLPEVLESVSPGSLLPVSDLNAWTEALIDRAHWSAEQRAGEGKRLRAHVAAHYTKTAYVERLSKLYDDLLRQKGGV